MALKFLNKKGWHTGSLRNIENVWKAEQKHEAEQRKLEELRKQIQEERERAEFRLLQERAGLVPRQERLEFLYESGLAVGKGSSDGFKALQAPPKAEASAAASKEPSASKAAVPGALFEDKPQSANDAWRKLHTDPLLLIRQREQEAIARIKNNPIQMAMIKKSAEAERQQKEKSTKKKKKKEHKKHRHSKSKHDKRLTESSGSEDTGKDEEERNDRSRSMHPRVKSKHDKHLTERSDSEDTGKDREEGSDRSRSRRYHSRREDDGMKGERRFSGLDNEERIGHHISSDNRRSGFDREGEKGHAASECNIPGSDHGTRNAGTGFDRKRERTDRMSSEHHRPGSDSGSRNGHRETQASGGRQDSGYTHHRRAPPRLTEEERAARLREMRLDAELHEEQRWKRIKKASEADAREAIKDKSSSGRNFLDATQKSLFGTEKGGRSTIEESVRSRSYYRQGGADSQESNAFRRH